MSLLESVVYGVYGLSSRSGRFRVAPPDDGLSSLFPAKETIHGPLNGICFIIVLGKGTVMQVSNGDVLLPRQAFLFLPPKRLLLQLSYARSFLFRCLSFDFSFLSSFPLLLGTSVSGRIAGTPYLPVSPRSFDLVGVCCRFVCRHCLSTRYPSRIVGKVLFSLMLRIYQVCSNEGVSMRVSQRSGLMSNFFDLLRGCYARRQVTTFCTDQLYVSSGCLVEDVGGRAKRAFRC